MKRNGRRMVMDTKKVIKFVVITYLIAWTIQIAVSLYKVNNPGMTGTTVFQMGLAVCMFAPLVAALISKAGFKGMGWKPKFKGNVGWLFFAAYGVIPVVAAGAALFFVIFPNFFDTTGSYYIAATESAGVDIAEELAKAGMSIQTYTLVSMAALIYAPFINIFTAIGEEAGWRGFLYPELNKKFNRPVVWIIGGSIWAAFHFPAPFSPAQRQPRDPAPHRQPSLRLPETVPQKSPRILLWFRRFS